MRTSPNWGTEAASGYSLTTALKSSRFPHKYIYDHLHSMVKFPASYVRECLRINNSKHKQKNQPNHETHFAACQSQSRPPERENWNTPIPSRQRSLIPLHQRPSHLLLRSISPYLLRKHWRNRTMKEPPPTAKATLSTKTTKGNTSTPPCNTLYRYKSCHHQQKRPFAHSFNNQQAPGVNGRYYNGTI